MKLLGLRQNYILTKFSRILFRKSTFKTTLIIICGYCNPFDDLVELLKDNYPWNHSKGIIHPVVKSFKKICLDHFSQGKGVLKGIVSNPFSTTFYFH